MKLSYISIHLSIGIQNENLHFENIDTQTKAATEVTMFHCQ
jgi:hypothetical protein